FISILTLLFSMYRVSAGVEEFRACLVCEDRITAMHLGMDTCRACSSFFKRTKTLDREYPCRQGDRRCVVSKEEKFTCRGCRFDKCLAVGMQYEGPMRIRTKRPVPLLERIELEYRSFLDRRKVRELLLIESSGNLSRIPHEREVLYLFKEDVTNTPMFTITVEETYHFFKRVFTSTFDPTDEELIFKEFVGKFIMIEAYQRTMRIFGEINQYGMCSQITCIEVNNFLDEMKGDSFDDKLIKSSARSYVNDETSVFLPIFLKSDISDKEFFTLTVLLMCEIEDDCSLSDEALRILEDIRKSTFQELQIYYRLELGISEFSVRVGNLMSLNHAMQECKSLFQVHFRFFTTIFDDCQLDDKMQNLFM
ncbi:hypothetical protein PENTCL1PPCAC_16851, partial [Pristionchus entomophagus]